MAETLLLRLHENDDPVDWVIVGDHGRPVTEPGRDALASLAPRATGRRVVALAPGEDVLLTEAHVPARASGQLRRAVPYAIEEQLIQDVEDLHFALGERGRDGTVPVAVCSRARLDHWMDRLREAGLEPARFVPEPLALPWEPGTWTVLSEPHRACMRTGPSAGLALERDNLGTILSRAYDEEDTSTRPQRIVHFATDEQTLEAPAGVELEPRPREAAITLLARGLGERRAIDLRQGPYSQRAELGRVWRPWRAAAGLAATLLVVHLVGLGIDSYRLSSRSAQLEQRIEAVYRDAFPNAGRIEDARVQMRQQLAKLRRNTGGGGGLMELLAACGPVLAATEGLELTGLNYRDGTLSVDVTIGDLQALDALKQTLTERPELQAEIQGATARDERVEGRLEIKRRT